jgi:hypothetical protein
VVAPATPLGPGPFLPHASPPRGKARASASLRGDAKDAATQKRTRRTKGWKNARCRCGSGRSQGKCCG